MRTGPAPRGVPVASTRRIETARSPDWRRSLQTTAQAVPSQITFVPVVDAPGVEPTLTKEPMAVPFGCMRVRRRPLPATTLTNAYSVPFQAAETSDFDAGVFSAVTPLTRTSPLVP